MAEKITLRAVQLFKANVTRDQAKAAKQSTMFTAALFGFGLMILFTMVSSVLGESIEV